MALADFLKNIFPKKESPIFLFNSLSRKKELFVPLEKKEVSIYTCGPTVYNYLHIGNLRAYVFADILKRVFLYNGYKVTHIMNVTDIGHLTSDADSGDDKMVKALIRENKPMTLSSMREIANKYFKIAKEDMGKLNILPANHYPFASDHLQEDLDMIHVLLEKGYAYKISDGIYFDTKKFKNYGALGLSKGDIEHARISENSEKRNIEDFALWKFSKNEIGFESPLGKGFPGWHIECSAMSIKYLGDTFDIHTGGVDHIMVHHNNEIAQSESFTGKKFVNYWMHNEHLTIGKDKMAKSGDNFLTLNTLHESGIHSLAYRYWLLTSRYSTRIDYSAEAIKASQIAYEKLHSFFNSLKTETHAKPNPNYKNKFLNAINNDLDTPKALALVWEIVKDNNLNDAEKKSTLLDFDKVLGLMLGSVIKENSSIPEEIKEIAKERKLARENKDWQKSDELRNKIESLGFNIKDTENGFELQNKD